METHEKAFGSLVWCAVVSTRSHKMVFQPQTKIYGYDPEYAEGEFESNSHSTAEVTVCKISNLHVHKSCLVCFSPVKENSPFRACPLFGNTAAASVPPV